MQQAPLLDRGKFLSGAAAAFGSVAFVRAPAQAAQFQYKLSHYFPTSHPYDVAAHAFAASVQRESNGRIEITVFPNNVLGSDAAQLQQLRSGALELNLVGSVLANTIPSAGITLVGFCFKDRRVAIAAMEGSVGTLIRNDMSAKGMVAFQRVWEAGFRQTATNVRPINTPEDVAGLKLRVPVNPIAVDMWKTLGASPTPLSLNELYVALQTHVVQGCDGAYDAMLSQKLYEVEPYLSVTNHQWSFTWLIMNGDAWNALPPDLQTILRRNADKAGIQESAMAATQNPAAAAELARRGMAINATNMDSFRQQLAPYYQRWKNEFGPAAWSALEQYTGKLG